MMRMEKAGSKEGDSAKRRRNGNGAKIIGSGTLNGKSFFIRRIGSNPSCVCRPDFERPWTMWWHSFAQNAVRRQSASPLTSRRAEKALASCSPPETGWVRSSQTIKTDSPKNGGSFELADWSPLVDITEDDHEYLFKADLPEMKKDDVKVTIENGILYISGERRAEKEEKKRKFHRLERFFGTFERTFTVPEDADPTKIMAEFHDGVLQVHLPKRPMPKPKTIEVKVQ